MNALELGAIVARPPRPRADRHWLSGTVKIDGAPGSRRVVLLRRADLLLLAATRSRTDGTYEFKGLPEYPERALLAIAFDDDEQKHNAEIADFLTQVREQATTGTGD